MNKYRHVVRYAFLILFVCLLVVLTNACSLPKIIILNDPLNSEEHAKLGRIYESEAKTDLALQQYEAAVKLDPKSVSSLLLLGDLSFRVGNYERAESVYKKAAALQPGNGDIYNNLCWVYLKQDRRTGEAEDLIQKALAATPDHRGYYLDTKGVVLLKLDRVDESITAFREALDLIPPEQTGFRAEAYAHLAEAYRKKGDEARSREADRAAEALSKP